jgi:hypothetical protein
MERIADMEDYKSARAVRSETQGGAYPRDDFDKGNNGGEKLCMWKYASSKKWDTEWDGGMISVKCIGRRGSVRQGD